MILLSPPFPSSMLSTYPSTGNSVSALYVQVNVMYVSPDSASSLVGSAGIAGNDVTPASV
jgi:hypothetical protein